MIISPTLKVQERDGGLFVDNVRVRTRDATGRLDEDTAEALRIYDKRARLHTCRVCRSRFIGIGTHTDARRNAAR